MSVCPRHRRKRLPWLLLLIFSLPPGSVGIAEEESEVEQATQRLVAAAVVYDEIEMQSACQELCDLASVAVPHLLLLTEHANSVVRWKAVATLEQMGPIPVREQAQVMRAAVNAAADADADVRAAAAELALRWFPQHSDTQVLMQRLVSDSNSVVRSNAWYGCWVIESGSKPIDQLVALLQDSDWMAADQAAEHLIRIGEPAETHLLGAANELLTESGSATTQARLVRTLAAVSRSAAVQRELVGWLSHEQISVVQAAARAVVEDGETAVPALLRLLDSNDPKRKVIALQALAAIGDSANSAYVQIHKYIQRESPVAIAAILAIPHLKSPDDELRSDYAALIESPNRDVRGAAVAAIAIWGPDAASFETRLARMQQIDPVDFVRQAAKNTLMQIRTSRESVRE